MYLVRVTPYPKGSFPIVATIDLSWSSEQSGGNALSTHNLPRSAHVWSHDGNASWPDMAPRVQIAKLADHAEGEGEAETVIEGVIDGVIEGAYSQGQNRC